MCVFHSLRCCCRCMWLSSLHSFRWDHSDRAGSRSVCPIQYTAETHQRAFYLTKHTYALYSTAQNFPSRIVRHRLIFTSKLCVSLFDVTQRSNQLFAGNGLLILQQVPAHTHHILHQSWDCHIHQKPIWSYNNTAQSSAGVKAMLHSPLCDESQLVCEDVSIWCNSCYTACHVSALQNHHINAAIIYIY